MRSLFLLFCLNAVAAAQVVEPEYPLDLAKAGLKLPETKDPELQRIYSSPNTVFYKLPQVWQHWIPSAQIEQTNLTTGLKSIRHTESVFGLFDPTWLPEFNANDLFPWETTIGLNTSRKETNAYGTVNFFNLPEENGQPKPILVISEYPIKWIFPVGTTVGEIIYVTHNNKKYVQEIRTRTKTEDSLDWEPSLYRPVENRQEFMQMTGLNYKPAYKYMFFRNPQEDEVFKMEGLVERLPPVADATVIDLLGRPFQKTEEFWSPAADQEFHILPKNYCFSLLKSVDAHTCASCHRQTQISVWNLTPLEPLIINNPAKVGNIRGCDAVFTWHPFTNASKRMNDTLPVPQVGLRAYDRDKKFVRVFYNKGETVPEGYKLTKFVQEALKPYELPNAAFLHSEK